MALCLDYCVFNFAVTFSPLAPVILGTQDSTAPRKLLVMLMGELGGKWQAFTALL